MRKHEFMRRLSNCLVLLPETERQATLEFYIEQIDDRIDDGMDEEQAVASLESPEDIAAAILINRDADKDAAPLKEASEYVLVPEKKRSIGKIVLIILIILALALTCFIWMPVALIIIAIPISIYLGLWGILLAAAAAVVGFALGGVILISIGIGTMSTSVGAAISHIGAGIGCLGLGILCALIAIYGTIALVKGTIKSFKWLSKKITERKRKRVSNRLVLHNKVTTGNQQVFTIQEQTNETDESHTINKAQQSPKRPQVINGEEDYRG